MSQGVLGRSERRSVVARAASALSAANEEMTHLLDVGEVPDGSPLDRKVQAALTNLYDALESIKTSSRRQAELTERGPLVFPVRNRDMRYWRMEDGRMAFALLSRRQASRYASAKKVRASTSLQKYRVMTASQYLRELERAVFEEDAPMSPRTYTRTAQMTSR